MNFYIWKQSTSMAGKTFALFVGQDINYFSVELILFFNVYKRNVPVFPVGNHYISSLSL